MPRGRASVWGALYPQTKDAAGNVVAERIQNSPNQVDRTYKWDAAGRQAQVTDPPVHSWEVSRSTETAYDGGAVGEKLTKSFGAKSDYSI